MPRVPHDKKEKQFDMIRIRCRPSTAQRWKTLYNYWAAEKISQDPFYKPSYEKFLNELLDIYEKKVKEILIR